MLQATHNNSANVYNNSDINNIIPFFDNKDVSQDTYSKMSDVYNQTEIDLLMAHNEPLFITIAPIINNLIIRDNGELGIYLELTSDFVDAVNTLTAKADTLTYYLKSEVDNKFASVNDLIINNYFTKSQSTYSLALNADLNTQVTLMTNNTNATSEINTKLNTQ